MPRSLHIVGSKTLGGAERFYLRLIEALKERGEDVRALVRRGSEVAAEVGSAIPTFQAPMRAVWDLPSRWEISRMVDRLKPDLVQTYMGRATRLTHLERTRSRPVHVARLGGYYKLDGYRHADAWIGNTRGVCDYMIRGGLPASRVFHIYNFIDSPTPLSEAERRRLRESLRIPQDALVLVTAGRFVEVKGHEYLLDAFSRVPAEVHERPLWLVMVGDGLLREPLHRQARELQVNDRIAWTGWQTDPGKYYEIADLVVFPSLERETLGNVILEAWAHGRPLVTTEFAGALEIVRHGVDAWRVPCRDAKALADGIAMVLRDEHLAMALAEKGRSRVDREFGRAAIVDQYLALYDQLLSGRG